MTEWIKVGSKLPDTGKTVIIYCSINKHVGVGEMRITGMKKGKLDISWEGFGSSIFTYNVTHWAELPNPPTD